MNKNKKLKKNYVKIKYMILFYILKIFKKTNLTINFVTFVKVGYI